MNRFTDQTIFLLNVIRKLCVRCGPRQGFIARRGNEYLRGSFPKLDYLTKATIKR